MTVCIATLFTWVYGPSDTGLAVLTISDRMITAGDVEYEPQQVKTCFLTKNINILIAGDYPTHSEVLAKIQRHVESAPAMSVTDVAEMYADTLAAIKHREAARVYLHPLGLTANTFLTQQTLLSSDLVSLLTKQMQGWKSAHAEALIVGVDDKNAQIYMADSSGSLSCENDIGFSAIGIGAWHAKSQFMQARWASNAPFAPALAVSFAAKKNAEVAPGVGSHTDMHIITKSGCEIVNRATQERLKELYDENVRERTKLFDDGLRKLVETFKQPAFVPSNPELSPNTPTSDAQEIAHPEDNSPTFQGSDH